MREVSHVEGLPDARRSVNDQINRKAHPTSMSAQPPLRTLKADPANYS